MAATERQYWDEVATVARLETEKAALERRVADLLRENARLLA